MPLLAAKALHFRHGQARHVHIGQGLAYFVELEWFDDGGNLFHGFLLIDNRQFFTNWLNGTPQNRSEQVQYRAE
ncbi:hypothetical protein D3C72_2479820 [compost metagenome]